jgi:hypothetical protein
MAKFKVTSGEFEVIVNETTLRKAGDFAVQLHSNSNHPSSLGELTLIEKLNRNSQPTGKHVFLSTQTLLDENTAGLGSDMGQYSRIEEVQ